MAERGVVRVQPEGMHVASQALSNAANDLHTRLIELDNQVRELLAGWHGGSGDAYGRAWDLWHRGTADVQLGLSILARGVGVTGLEFDSHEQASSQTMDGVYHG